MWELRAGRSREHKRAGGGRREGHGLRGLPEGERWRAEYSTHLRANIVHRYAEVSSPEVLTQSRLLFFQRVFVASLNRLEVKAAVVKRRLLAAVAGDLEGEAAELKDGDLGACALAHAEPKTRRADARADVDDSLWRLLCLNAASVEAVHKTVTGEAAHHPLLEPADGELAAVRVAGEDEWDPSVPELVGAVANVGEPDGGDGGVEAARGGLDVVIAGERVVHPDQLQALATDVDLRPLVRKDLDVGALQRSLNLSWAAPVVVISEDRVGGALNAGDDFLELVEVFEVVRDVVAGEEDEVGFGLVHALDRLALQGVRRGGAKVLVRQMRDAQRALEALSLRVRSREVPRDELVGTCLKPLHWRHRVIRGIKRDVRV